MWLSIQLTCALMIALVVLQPASVSAEESKTDCPDGWTGYGSSCYLYVDDAQSWQNAQVSCMTLKGNLVRIDNEKENDDVTDFVYKHGNNLFPWIGMSNLEVRSQFKLIFSHAPAPFLNFREGEPNNSGGNERCVQFWGRMSGEWNDETCSRPFPFICEI